MKKTRTIHMITLALAVVAMILPYGAVCRFIEHADNGVGHEVIETYSYFDLLPFGYANFGPLLTAILTCVLLLLVFASFYVNDTKVLRMTILVLSSLALVCSLLPLIMYGFQFYTVTGMAISYLLGCSLLFSVQQLTGRYFLDPDEEDEE